LKWLKSMHLRAIYWFLSLLNIYFTILAELIETGPMRALICETGLFYQDKIQIMMKMSSLMKFRIIDHELCVCEYGLRAQSSRLGAGYPIISWCWGAGVAWALDNHVIGTAILNMTAPIPNHLLSYLCTDFVKQMIDIVLLSAFHQARNVPGCGGAVQVCHQAAAHDRYLPLPGYLLMLTSFVT
jgi:hypothetical protein